MFACDMVYLPSGVCTDPQLLIVVVVMVMPGVEHVCDALPWGNDATWTLQSLSLSVAESLDASPPGVVLSK